MPSGAFEGFACGDHQALSEELQVHWCFFSVNKLYHLQLLTALLA